MGTERSVFSREGEYWTIRYGGTLCRLRDAAGLQYLACLLHWPGQRFPATELVQVARGGAPARSAFARSTSPTERARVTVTRSIRTTMHRIAVHNPQLGEHLAATIKTGRCCMYMPNARLFVKWEVRNARS